jgi:hypothetical protein
MPLNHEKRRSLLKRRQNARKNVIKDIASDNTNKEPRKSIRFPRLLWILL